MTSLTLLDLVCDRTTRRAALEQALVAWALLGARLDGLGRVPLSAPCRFIMREIAQSPTRCQLDLIGALEDELTLAGQFDETFRGEVRLLAEAASRLTVGELAELGDLRPLVALLCECVQDRRAA